MTWLDAILGRKPKHEHRFGDWFLVERQEACGFTEMMTHTCIPPDGRFSATH